MIQSETAPALADLRSKHNTYMSFPLIFFMISNHFPVTVYGTSNDAVFVPLAVAGFVAVGWFLAMRCYSISAWKSTSDFGYAAADASAASAEKK